VVEPSDKEIAIQHSERTICVAMPDAALQKNPHEALLRGGDLEQIKFVLGHFVNPDCGTLSWLGAEDHSCRG
jgi:hypothetical protein